MQLNDLTEHLVRGGAATLNHPATYSVEPGALIAPARYAGSRGSEFVFERRYVDGEFRDTTLVDSKSSQLNRAEEGLLDARADGGPATRMPVLAVEYPSTTLLDLQLPHRAFDAHIRAATEGGIDVVKQPWYRALRDATAHDLSPVFTTSPVTLAFGGWDSSRGRRQLRLRSLLVSELFGVVAGREAVSNRSGARLDPLGQEIRLSSDQIEELLSRQEDEMSAATVAKQRAAAAAARKKKEPVSASGLLLGGIPPSLEAPFGVAVPEVRRVRSFSLVGLRRLRFGGTADEDLAARRALLGVLLLGAAYADADPQIRANCDLGAPQGEPQLDGKPVELDLGIESCAQFLSEAIDALPERLAWTGQVRSLTGHPPLDHGATDDAAGDD